MLQYLLSLLIQNFGDNPGRKWLDHFLHSNTLPKEQSNELNGSRGKKKFSWHLNNRRFF